MTTSQFPALDALLKKRQVVAKGDTKDQPIFEQVWNKTYRPIPATKRKPRRA